MENNWKNIWSKRKTNVINFDALDEKQLVLELKRIDGFDIEDSKITYKAFVEEFNKTTEHLNENKLGGGVYQFCF